MILAYDKKSQILKTYIHYHFFIFTSSTIYHHIVRYGLKGRLWIKGRWTQTQLHTGGKDKGNKQKVSFY